MVANPITIQSAPLSKAIVVDEVATCFFEALEKCLENVGVHEFGVIIRPNG
jgi:hypothetical protein